MVSARGSLFTNGHGDPISSFCMATATARGIATTIHADAFPRARSGMVVAIPLAVAVAMLVCQKMHHIRSLVNKHFHLPWFTDDRRWDAAHTIVQGLQPGTIYTMGLLMTDDGMRHIRLFQICDLFLGQMHGQGTDGIFQMRDLRCADDGGHHRLLL